MRKLTTLIAAVGVVVAMAATPVMADEYDELQSHPLRILAYVIHPVGFAAEWLITRPIHELVSQPDLEPVFGHGPHGYYGVSAVNTADARLLDE
jgi:hypothetical protein